MREIKFRAWNKKTKKMATPFYIISTDGRWGIQNWMGDFSGESTTSSFPVIVMQYTGLKDKNGKEIYEGDVIQRKEYGKFKKYVVRFFELAGAFYRGKFYKGGYQYHYSFGYSGAIRYEVIGNMYENPELLGGD